VFHPFIHKCPHVLHSRDVRVSWISWTFISTKVTMRTTFISLQKVCILLTECVYEFRVILCINSSTSLIKLRHGGASGERMYSSYSFTISALDGCELSASRPGRALPRGKDPRYPLYRRLGGPQSWSGHRG
jgi:hypothetical protein